MLGSYPPYPDELARRGWRLIGTGWPMEEEGPKASDDRKNGELHRICFHRNSLAKRTQVRSRHRLLSSSPTTDSLDIANLQARRFNTFQRRLDGRPASSAHLQAIIA